MRLSELKDVRDEWEGDTHDLDEKLASGEIPEHDNMYAKAVIELHRALSNAIERIAQLEAELEQRRTQIEHLQPVYLEVCVENEALMKAVGFFCSAIKSGETWTDTCQERYDALPTGED